MPRPHAFFPFGRVQSTEGQTHAASESVHQPPPSKDDCERPPLSAESGVVCTPPSVYSAVVTAARSGAGEHEKEHNHVRTTAPRQRGGGTLIESKAGKISRATSVASSSVICVCVCVCVFGSGRRTAPGAAVLRVDDPPPPKRPFRLPAAYDHNRAGIRCQRAPTELAIRTDGGGLKHPPAGTGLES